MFSCILVQKLLHAEARHQEHLTCVVTSGTIQWLLFDIWLCFSRSLIQSFCEAAVWLVYTMSADPSKPVTTVSKPQKRHAEMFQLALREPSLQPEAGLAMPGCALPQLDSTARRLRDPGWQIYMVLHWAMGTHQLDVCPRLLWVSAPGYAIVLQSSLSGKPPQERVREGQLHNGNPYPSSGVPPLSTAPIRHPGLRIGTGDDEWCIKSLDMNINWVVPKWLDKVVKQSLLLFPNIVGLKLSIHPPCKQWLIGRICPEVWCCGFPVVVGSILHAVFAHVMVVLSPPFWLRPEVWLSCLSSWVTTVWSNMEHQTGSANVNSSDTQRTAYWEL